MKLISSVFHIAYASNRTSSHCLSVTLSSLTNQSFDQIMDAAHADDMIAQNALVCSSCDTPLGTLDGGTSSYKLAKLAISVSHGTEQLQSLSITKWLSCHLLSAMDNQGLRRIIVTSGTGMHKALVLWLFTPDLGISSSASPANGPLRVTKILWKPAPTQVQEARLDAQSLSEGEIEMPEFELDALRRSLEDSAVLLPEEARNFQDWKVALLERFTEEDDLSI